jgi:hypothetical protein
LRAILGLEGLNVFFPLVRGCDYRGERRPKKHREKKQLRLHRATLRDAIALGQ